MSRTRICIGELTGCQPDWKNLENIWDTALRGIDDKKREVLLTHIIDGHEIVRGETLDKLKSDAGDPATYGNLTMQVSQKSPLREIEIKIGPGRFTAVSVEAEDHTWAIGRHAEIMEKFVRTRKKYASGSSYVPQWPRRRQVTIGSVTVALGSAVLSVALAYGFLFVVIFVVSVLVDPSYLIVSDLNHHKPVPHKTIAWLFVAIALVVLAVAAIVLVVSASKSKVVVRTTPFWTANRSGAVAAVAAAVSALAAIITLFVI